jgi:hypothetical protein
MGRIIPYMEKKIMFETTNQWLSRTMKFLIPI